MIDEIIDKHEDTTCKTTNGMYFDIGSELKLLPSDMMICVGSCFAPAGRSGNGMGWNRSRL
jgi:hypothetical protein